LDLAILEGAVGGFLSGIFGGSNPTLNNTINNAGGISQFGTNTGQGAITDANSYYQNILSGDPSKIAESIAPEIQAGQQQTQQAKQGMAQFGTRSGGTAAASAGADAANRGNIIYLIGKLQQGAASGETGIGENQTAQGLQANGQQAALSQEQLQNYMNSILGQGISGGVGYGESFLPVAHGG
jgi:hypothetical protein